MKGLIPLFLGIFGTFAFSWIGLTVIPNAQIGHLDPQSDDEGTDIYPMPPSGMAVRGRHVFTGNGCIYCHTEQIRPDYAGSDIERKWGDRRSAPRDYIFARPVALGKMRLGPDLSNIGKRTPNEDENAAAASAPPSASPANSPAGGAAPAGSPAAGPATAAASPAAPNASPSPAVGSQTKPGEPLPYSAAWHHRHLYAPRSVAADSNMPAYRFLYEKRRISGQRSDDALPLTGRDALPDGYEVVPTQDAKCLVAYLMSLNQSHPLKELKTSGGAAPAPAASTAAPAAPAAAAAPPAAPAPKK